MSSLIFRIICQLKNDRRTLALLIFAPILVLTLINFILGDSNYTPTITLIDMPDEFVSKLEENSDVTKVSNNIDIDDYLKNKNADAVIWMEPDGLHIRMLEATSKTATITKLMKGSITEDNESSSNIITDFVYGTDDESQFNSLGYIFLGILSFFFVFVISGMSLVRERSNQTMERMLMTPIRRFKVIGGYTIGFGIFSAIQSIIMLLYAHYILGIGAIGSILLCILIMVILAIVAVSLGALVSIFANSEFQVVQFVPIVIVTQVFFSGLIPIDTIPYGLGNLCYLMPIYYGCTSLKMVMIQGANLAQITPWLSGLCIYGILLFILNSIALKKYRKI